MLVLLLALNSLTHFTDVQLIPTKSSAIVSDVMSVFTLIYLRNTIKSCKKLAHLNGVARTIIYLTKARDRQNCY